MLNVSQVYMTHYEPLTDRKEKIIKEIPFDLKWVQSEPHETYWNTNPQEWAAKLPSTPARPLTQAETSLAHKHIECYKDIVKNHHELSLVLEDDVILNNDFINLFNSNLQNTPIDWDLIFIGSGCGLGIPYQFQQPNKVAYKVPHPASKCTDSYCITYEAAKKILSTIIPFTFPIDFELNYQMELHHMNVYWWEPSLVVQGSQCGVFGSAIQES
tara:strand:+ start:3041 stop:3682 length:642 start_codon:yes stop_codon:yes gene_type:complete